MDLNATMIAQGVVFALFISLWTVQASLSSSHITPSTTGREAYRGGKPRSTPGAAGQVLRSCSDSTRIDSGTSRPAASRASATASWGVP